MSTQAKSSFLFNPYPYRYVAKYDTSWTYAIEECAYLSEEDETKLSDEERLELYRQRNSADSFPLVNYTTQYGLGCFEGLKAYPQKNGSLAVFRVDANAKRFYNSMEGLLMPPFPQDMFMDGVISLLKNIKNKKLYAPYNPTWEDDNFMSAKSIYIRPFSYAEGGIGIKYSTNPYVFIVATEVGSYFGSSEVPTLLVSKSTRATPYGTGWIKCASNYVISILEKNKAMRKGYTEALFLDSQEHKYVEECSSCNIFFVLENNRIVTPSLKDTILPGITRDSIITILKDKGYTVEERNISIEEVMDDAKECFTTGTAVGVNHFGKLTYNDKEKTFCNDGCIGRVAEELQVSLKRIQYGLDSCAYDWLITI